MIPELLSSSIIPFTWTDHCVVLSTLTSLIPKTQDSTWHINEPILSHPSHSSDLEIAIKDYLADNETPDISPLTLWEAHIPVLRGVCIRQASFLKREKRQLKQKLEAECNTCHTIVQSNPTPVTKLELDKARLNLDLFLSESVEKMLCKSKHIFYLKANKPDTLLARALKKRNRSFKLIRLKLSHDTFTSNPVKILHTFQKHLASLYKRKYFLIKI